MRILVVDDERIICDGTVRMVKDVVHDAEVIGYNDPAEALRDVENNETDVVFLDIQMPGMNGIDFAKSVKRVRPECNIIFITAYREYQGEAWEMRASGYVVKPVTRERIRLEIDELRHRSKANASGKRLVIKAFGDFQVLWNGNPVKFRYTKTLELLAFLVDRNGAMMSIKSCIDALWSEGEIRDSYFKQIRRDMQSVFEGLGIGDIIVKKRGYLGIVRDMVSCDYFDWLDGMPSGINAYRGEYMRQYTWAEETRESLAGKGGEKR